jgi:hypothetical protein
MFEPTNLEIHISAAGWFWDQEIYDWIGSHLNHLHPLDLRWYSEAYSDRIAGRDWADLLLKSYALDAAEAVVQDLEHDPSHPTREDKARKFSEIMAGRKGSSRANYHNILARLRKSKRLDLEAAPVVQVRGKKPIIGGHEEMPAPPADIPQRDMFARPITGQTGQTAGQGQTHRAEADDTLAWERRSDEEDE